MDVPATVPKSLKDANNNAVCFTVMRSDLQNMLAAQLPPGAYPPPSRALGACQGEEGKRETHLQRGARRSTAMPKSCES